MHFYRTLILAAAFLAIATVAAPTEETTTDPTYTPEVPPPPPETYTGTGPDETHAKPHEDAPKYDEEPTPDETPAPEYTPEPTPEPTPEYEPSPPTDDGYKAPPPKPHYGDVDSAKDSKKHKPVKKTTKSNKASQKTMVIGKHNKVNSKTVNKNTNKVSQDQQTKNSVKKVTVKGKVSSKNGSDANDNEHNVSVGITNKNKNIITKVKDVKKVDTREGYGDEKEEKAGKKKGHETAEKNKSKNDVLVGGKGNNVKTSLKNINEKSVKQKSIVKNKVGNVKSHHDVSAENNSRANGNKQNLGVSIDNDSSNEITHSKSKNVVHGKGLPDYAPPADLYAAPEPQPDEGLTYAQD